MAYPPQAPWTGIGSLQSDVNSIKSELRGKANQYEVSSLNSRLDVVVNSIREIGSICDAFLSRLETCEADIQEIKRQLEDKR